MKIHHLNCGSIFPLFPRGTQSILYCLLIESNDGLILIDTGFGTEDYRQPTKFIRLFIALLGVPRLFEETAVCQVEALGYSRSDVKHIVMTHLHSDHAGGLRDFPHALVHIHQREYDAIQRPRGFKDLFYEPVQWAHEPNWVIHGGADHQDWFGVDSIVVSHKLRPEIRLVPLHGHSRGHCGIAVRTGPRWLLHCGDATYPFYQNQAPAPPMLPLPPFIQAPPKWLEKGLLGEQTPRLKQLHAKCGEQIQFICSNDSISFSLANRGS